MLQQKPTQTHNRPQAGTLANTIATGMAAAVFMTLLPAAHAADLTVEVQGVASTGGRVLIAVFDSAETFRVKPVRVAAAPAADAAGQLRLSVSDLAPGDYAYIVYHDANANNRLDMNAMGIPVEDFAFSNNAMGAGGAPTFAAARISVPTAGLVTTVNLR